MQEFQQKSLKLCQLGKKTQGLQHLGVNHYSGIGFLYAFISKIRFL